MTLPRYVDADYEPLFTRTYTSKVTGISTYLLKKWESNPDSTEILKPSNTHLYDKALYRKSDTQKWRENNHNLILDLK